ncbi:MAG: sodium:proton antiporter [Clostridia bacterium]|nr:sodium:proton antiporter [Clostridia bacterium]
MSTFVLCAAFWLLLTGSFDKQELIAGAIVSVAVALFSAKFLIHENAFWLFNPVKFFSLIIYSVIIFPWELLKANLDVAFRAFSSGPRVNPGIVKVPVGLASDYGKAMLADSITLTPGTITMDITEENEQTYYYIHWIDVTETDGEKAGDIIKGTLEKWVGRIWK